MNIEQFKGAFSDLARPNRFEVFVPRIGDTRMLAKGTAAPGQQIDAMDANFQGRVVKLPGDRTQADWTVTFYGDDSYNHYRALKRWSEEINGPESNVSAPPNAVKSDTRVVQLGRDGSQLFNWVIVGCFPTDVAQIDFEWSSNSTPLEFQVTFAFDYVQV